MCGIAGILNLDRAPVSPVVLRRMTDAIAHRGPDGDGTWVEEGVGFGHRRLAIIDLSPAGHQPMMSGDGRYVMTYNGEVYNFQELRVELEARGHQFRSRSDTEVVLNAYAEWGPAAVSRLNGMFALAIWDRRERTLFLARDRYGVKPLYVWQDGPTLLFASEVKAFRQHPAFRAGVDPGALLDYFTFQNVFGSGTLFDRVRILQPGHTMLVRPDGSETVERYWDYDFREPSEARSLEEYEEELHRLFVQAVRRQLVADVPVGAFLSGGMDSGAITAVASREIPHLVSVTGGFDLSSASGLELGFDERRRAEALSYRFQTEHYEVVLKAGDLERCLPSLVWHLEDLRVGQSYPNFYVSRLASKFVKVMLAGTGGDELFAGYPWRYYRTVASAGFDDYVQNYYVFWQRLVNNRTIHRLFQPVVWDAVRDRLTIDSFRAVLEGHKVAAPHGPEDYVNNSLYFECRTFLHGLLVVEDRLSMAHGLETRVPFLDNDLVDFAMRLPIRSKLRDLEQVIRFDENTPGAKPALYGDKTNDGKIILRQMLGRFLPEDYVNGTKQGFSGPDGSWFRGDSLAYVSRTLLEEDAALYRFLRPDTVRELVNEHLEGKVNRRLLIWSLLCFEWWCRIFLDGQVPGGSRIRE